MEGCKRAHVALVENCEIEAPRRDTPARRANEPLCEPRHDEARSAGA